MIRDATKGSFLREPRQVIAALRVLVLAALAMLGIGSPPDERFLYWFVTIVYGITIFGYLRARNREYEVKRIKWLIFLFDVVIVSCLIVLRGQHVQGFITAYFTLVLMAAIVEGLGNAVLNALVVSAVYTMLTQWGADWRSLLTFSTMGQFVFFFVIAIFMGHVAGEARHEAAARVREEEERKRIQEALGEKASQLRESTAQLREARESLRANDHLFTLGMLSAGIAHELKNPVAAILASVREAPDMLDEMEEAIRAGQPVEEVVEELRSVMADCEHASTQLHRIAMDLNDMVRGGSAETRTLDAEESLRGAERMMRSKAGPEIEMTVTSTAEQLVRADPGRLMQVLLNLTGNAIDAMKANGGTGKLTMSAEDAGANVVTFIVADNGPGMPEEVRQRMYDPFFTTKGPGEGTGLGLHLVHEIVKSQSGTIDCRTTVGEGTEFRVKLPAVPADVAGDLTHVGSTQDTADRGRRGNDPQGAKADLAA